MFDEDGFAIIHDLLKTSEQGKKQVAKVAAAGDDHFEKAYRKGVVSKFGQVGTWVWPWHNPETNEDENWHYSFLPVNGTPYQLVLTVVDRDVEEAAKKLEDELRVLTIIHLVITSVFTVLTGCLLVFVTKQLGLRFVTPIKHFAALLARAENNGFSEEAEGRAFEGVWSRELQTAITNFHKLLIAVRFGNKDYHKGDKAKEIGNLREVRALVEANGGLAGKRGLGICLSSMGNCALGMRATDRQKVGLQPDEEPIEIFRKAVENAKELASQEGSLITKDTVGGRCLSLGLAHLAANDGDAAAAACREALDLHKETRSWESLARLAYVLAVRIPWDDVPGPSSDPDPSTNSSTDPDQPANRREGSDQGSDSGLPPKLIKVAEEATQLGMQILQEDCKEQDLASTEGPCVAQLCFAHFVLNGRDRSVLFWALDNVPNLNSSDLIRLGANAKAGINERSDEDLKKAVAVLDAKLGDLTAWKVGFINSPAEVCGGSKNKVQVCFVMDCTGSMGEWIGAAKSQVISIADTIAAEAGAMTVEFSFVCYRDFSENENIVSTDFTTEVPSIKAFVATLEAIGGGDFPEDMAGGLAEASRMKWDGGNAVKFVVVVADAPCHGPRFHGGRFSDNYPDGGASGMPDPWLEKMKTDQQKLIFVRINAHTDTMIREFRKICDDLIEVDLSSGDASAFAALITKEVIANLPAGVEEHL